MTTRRDILYPFARSEDGRAVPIKGAEKGYRYECFGCSAPMVTKQGHSPTVAFCAQASL